MTKKVIKKALKLVEKLYDLEVDNSFLESYRYWLLDTLKECKKNKDDSRTT